MSGWEVAPSELRATGSQVTAFGPSVQGHAAGIATVAGSFSEPLESAAALDEMIAQWHSGLSRLADDVMVFGGLAQLAANGYERVDDQTMPEVVTAPQPPPGNVFNSPLGGVTP